jgi:hypothetical protein
VLDLPHTAQILDAITLPLIGGISLMLAKFSVGDTARILERHFLAILVVITGVTLRTVITCDQIWLLHTTTLGTLIVGALVIPSQESVAFKNT